MQRLAAMTRVLNAWEKHAPNKKFGGITLQHFRESVQSCLDANAKVLLLQWQLERLERTLEGDDAALPAPN